MVAAVQNEMKALEERLLARMDEQAQRILKESKRGDQEVAHLLRPEIQAVQDLVQRRYEEATEQAEHLNRSTLTCLRNELETTAGSVKQAGERNVEQTSTTLITKMNDGFQACQQRTEAVREFAEKALQETTAVLRLEAAESSKAHVKEAADLRNNIKSVETRCLQAADDAERKATTVSTKRLEDCARDLRSELAALKQASAADDATLRADLL